MAVVSIVLLIIFDVVLCSIEIPKMISKKLTKELVTFSVLLLLGTVLALLTSLNVKLPNPSDFLVWVYSPVSDAMKWLNKP